MITIMISYEYYSVYEYPWSTTYIHSFTDNGNSELREPGHIQFWNGLVKLPGYAQRTLLTGIPELRLLRTPPRTPSI